MQLIDEIPVFGPPDEASVQQIRRCHAIFGRAAMMADHHKGYGVPIGGVVAHPELISPSGVGFDIGCGNKAVCTDMSGAEARRNIRRIMDDVWRTISFGVGRKNKEEVDHELFEDDPAWSLGVVKSLRTLAREQLGTVGSGNHFVDILVDQQDRVWVGVHFGSRGFGHRIASYFMKRAGGKDDMDSPPVVLDATTPEGQDYIAAMQLAGRYAYAGRDWVTKRVVDLLGATVLDEVHNHHNFAWRERHGGEDLWVVRKGATPAFPGQRGFIGGSMGDVSVIVEGVDNELADHSLYSTVHGAGRVMGRRAAKKALTKEMMREWVSRENVELRGAGVDESPHCYKRLPEVLAEHAGTIRIEHMLQPIGVAMAGPDTVDPYKD